MKTLRFFALLAVIPLLSCSNDDGIAVVAPSLSFNQASIETPFFTEGTSEAPTLSWNGEEGTLSLSKPVQGVTIDPTDGTISWDKSLPLGLNDFQVIATNSVGTNTVDIQIDNRFSGYFIGGFNEDPESELLNFYFEFKYNADGTMDVMYGGEAIADGTWSLSGTSFTTVYTYHSGGNAVSLVMDIIYDNTTAHIEGFWYEGDNPVQGNESGFIMGRL